MEKNEKELSIGSIVKKKNSDDGSCYIFLGIVEVDELNSYVQKMHESILGPNPEQKMGWFSPFPLKLERKGLESEIPVYAWFISQFEKIENGGN